MLESESYFGAYTDREEPGYHLVGWQAFGDPDSEIELIKIPVLDVEGRCLRIEYEFLVEDLTDAEARSLIVEALLNKFYKHSYDPDVDEIMFVNGKTDARRLVRFVSGVLQ